MTAHTAPAPARRVTAPAVLFLNRELSWLDFNQRVLDQANDDTHPLLERVKFLAIVGSNLDEFFMVRVARLLQKLRAGRDELTADGMTVSQQLTAVRGRAAGMLRDQAACWDTVLRPALAREGIRFLEPDDYSDATRRFLAAYFKSDIYPLLTPLAFDPGHPFPLVSNRSKNFAVVIRERRRLRFARVKVPPLLPRFIAVPDGHRHTFAFLEDVIHENIGALFSGVEVTGAHLFRVLRDTHMAVPMRDPGDDDDDDLLETVDRTLKEQRHGALALLQADAAMPRRVLKILVENFEIENDVVTRTTNRLDYSDWIALHRLPLPALKEAPFAPRTLWVASQPDTCIFDDIREEDYFVHHPFDSFSAVEAFLQQAARDPLVVAIKMTLYRIGANSPLIDLLIDAADAGKQVAVLVELKARFDERNNIQWATRLEAAGVHVVYGVEGLKTHCKLCLVVRKDAEGVLRYAHIGTGNYNRATSQMYTDLGMFTANPMVVNDVSEVFNSLTGYARGQDYAALLVAPTALRKRFIKLIEREADHARAGRGASIVAKCNALTDPAIVRALYRASEAGVSIDLIVRSACALRPGVEDLSARIRVRSIVGRFLEHSRIYWFENGGRPEVFIGSADLMERNFDRRVEVLCPVSDADIANHLRTVVLDAYLRDNTRAYALVDDEYQKVRPEDGQPPFDAQQFLIDWYTANPAQDPSE
jgi:polyphosphate kinase